MDQCVTCIYLILVTSCSDTIRSLKSQPKHGEFRTHLEGVDVRQLDNSTGQLNANNSFRCTTRQLRFNQEHGFIQYIGHLLLNK